ncbi:MAG: hypothetical protein ABI850_13385, partial [Flavobacterium sp.]
MSIEYSANKTILVAPLNWGLGHATRCIPIIKALQENKYIPIIASDGVALSLLRKEFPYIETLELPSYHIEYAKNGMTGLESLFGVAGICEIGFEDFVKMQSENTRKIFNLPMPEIKAGSKANLTIFIPGIEYVFTEENIYSLSKNNAFIGKKL